MCLVEFVLGSITIVTERLRLRKTVGWILVAKLHRALAVIELCFGAIKEFLVQRASWYHLLASRKPIWRFSQLATNYALNLFGTETSALSACTSISTNNAYSQAISSTPVFLKLDRLGASLDGPHFVLTT